MTHASAIHKKTRAKLAKKYRDLYREERKSFSHLPVNNVQIGKEIGVLHEEAEPPVDADKLMLSLAFDREDKMYGVEVRSQEGVKLFVQPFEEVTAPSMKTEIVFINEGKGTVRKFEITVPSDTV